MHRSVHRSPAPSGGRAAPPIQAPRGLAPGGPGTLGSGALGSGTLGSGTIPDRTSAATVRSHAYGPPAPVRTAPPSMPPTPWRPAATPERAGRRNPLRQDLLDDRD